MHPASSNKFSGRFAIFTDKAYIETKRKISELFKLRQIMKILCVGDIVGSPGRRIFKTAVEKLRREIGLAAVIVNAENAAGGRGVTGAIAKELFDSGADVITLGDHVWDQRETASLLELEKRILRPANLPPACPGRGWGVFKTDLGEIIVMALVGRTFMNPSDCPFRKADELLNGPIPRNGIVICDFHAEATSEKIYMGWHLDGRVSAVFGTHTHVQTSDAKVLPEGTGYITDLGMTGPIDSVIGREIAPVRHRFTTGMPSQFDVAKGPAVLEGCIFDIDRTTRKTLSAKAVRISET